MAVRCSSCGEELLGAVNRCWRCGALIESHHGDLEQPPVRKSPLPQPVESEVLSGGTEEHQKLNFEPSDSDTIYDAVLSDETSTTPQASASTVQRRVGSPFAASCTPTASRIPAAGNGGPEDSLRRPDYPRNPAAAGGAVASLVLGLLSLGSSFFTVGALFLALVGLPMGIWGLSSNRRGQAIVGLLLCCIALAISGFGAAALLYELRYGISPWETPGSL